DPRSRTGCSKPVWSSPGVERRNFFDTAPAREPGHTSDPAARQGNNLHVGYWLLGRVGEVCSRSRSADSRMLVLSQQAGAHASATGRSDAPGADCRATQTTADASLSRMGRGRSGKRSEEVVAGRDNRRARRAAPRILRNLSRKIASNGQLPDETTASNSFDRCGAGVLVILPAASSANTAATQTA